MEYVANFMTCDLDPAAWAAEREAEGWQVLGCADHIRTDRRSYPHVWVTLATMAAAARRPLLTTSFANNLLRSPVEFAQAALQMQAVSGGRFEAGLGAGWTRDEIVGAGLAYPEAPERADRYAEAMTVVRALLRDGACRFTGAHYDIDTPLIGPRPPQGPPPLVASLGGPKTIRTVAPLVDRVELKLISSATRDGALQLPLLADVPRRHLTDLVSRVRAVNADAPLGVFILCNVGDDEATRSVERVLGDSFLGGFFGSAAKVADSMRALAAEGIARVQVSPFTDASFPPLAAELFGGG